MRFITVLSLFLFAPFLFAVGPGAISWSDLAQTVRSDWTIRMVLADGTTVEGKPARFDPDALSMRIVRTSNKSLHPKGEISIPRAQVSLIEIRQNRHKARRIGALVPVAAGIGLGVGLAASAGSGCSEAFICGIAAAAGAGIGLGIALVGGTAGYFIGRAVDRRFETVTITAP